MDAKKLPVKALIVITLSALMLAACDDARVRVSADTGPRYHSGPRIHSGYITHTPHNHRVSYDSALGMYIVLGLANTYWNNGRYYRYNNHHWQRSSDYRHWKRAQRQHVPNRLYKRHVRKHFRTHRGNRDRVRNIRPHRPRTNHFWVY